MSRPRSDDSLIVEYRRLAKVYAGEDPDALTTPGVVVRIRPCADPTVAEVLSWRV